MANATRTLLGTSALLVAALLLSGCAEIAGLADKTGIDLGLNELSTSLQKIPTVTAVTPTSSISADFEYSVVLEVSVDAVASDDITKIITAVEMTFQTPAFIGLPSRMLHIASPDGVVVSVSGFDFSAATVHDEVAHWIALTQAYGAPLELHLDMNTDQPSVPSRLIGAVAQATTAEPDTPITPVDWDALRAVPETPTALVRSWEFSGVSVQGSLPSREVATSLASLTSLAPGSGDGSDATLYIRSVSPDEIEVEVTSPEVNDPAVPDRSLGWSIMQQAAGLIGGAGLPTVRLTYNTGAEGISPMVHLGACADETPVSQADTSLWNALVASGVNLPTGSGPGYCGHA